MYLLWIFIAVSSAPCNAQSVASINQRTADSLYLKQDSAYFDKDFERAKELMLLAMKHRSISNDAQAQVELGNIEFALENFKEAINAYTKATELSKTLNIEGSAALVGINRSKERLRYIKEDEHYKIELQQLMDSLNFIEKDSTLFYSNKLAVLKKYPTYPGCQQFITNDELSRCLQQKVAQFIAGKFRTELANRIKVYGRLRINTSLTLNSDGSITNLKAKAMHPFLEKEALRLLGLLTDFNPGINMQGDQVGVNFSLPILYVVE